MEEEELALSDVQIDEVDRQRISIGNYDSYTLTCSRFFIFKEGLKVGNKSKASSTGNREITATVDEDGDLILQRPEKCIPDFIIEIDHTLETTISDVGLQIWQGCLFLCDFILENDELFEAKTVLELGGGVGLASIVAARNAKSVICTGLGKKIDAIAKKSDCGNVAGWKKSISNHLYWTAATTPDGDGELMKAKWKMLALHIQNVHEDQANQLHPLCGHGDLDENARNKLWIPADIQENILQMCSRNAEKNRNLYKYNNPDSQQNVIKIRKWDWLQEIPNKDSSEVSWAEPDIENIDIIIAADVIYDDKLTDAFFNVTKYVMAKNKSSTLYLALEKRLNFTISDLQVCCPAYRYFEDWIQRLLGSTDFAYSVEQITEPVNQHFQYSRTDNLELWKITRHLQSSLPPGGEISPKSAT